MEIKEMIEEVIMLATLLNYEVKCFDFLFEERIFLEKDNKTIYLHISKVSRKLLAYIYKNRILDKKIVYENYNDIIEQIKKNL